MRWWPAIGAALVAALGSGSVRAQAPAGEQDLGAEVRSVFARKCAGCHGPDLPKPQGRFGYVLDLRRVAGNPELVVPGRPDESELWILVSRGDMPPADSPRGPLTAEEKVAVRAWVAAGAPDVRQSADLSPSPDPELPTRSLPDRVVRFLGKFHLLLLHFPLALLVAAGIGDFLAWRGGRREPSPVVRFCLTFAAVAVVPTVVFGWLHAASGNGTGSPELLAIHRWLGTAAGLWVIAAALYARWDACRGVRSWRGRATLAAGGVLICATAHAGGLLAHGRNFFDW